VPSPATHPPITPDQRRRRRLLRRRRRDEFELLLLEEFELLLLDELELLLLDELDELLPASTIGSSAVSPLASASMSRPCSGRGECDQSPSLAGICLATAEPPVSSAASAPSDTNILRSMATAPHWPVK
jgi:hypothetical protein